MSGDAIRQTILGVIDKIATAPDANMQSGSILRNTMNQLNAQRDTALQQAILTSWHDLVCGGYVAWGMNMMNTDPPFCHLTKRGRETLKHLSRGPSNPDGYLELLREIRVNGTRKDQRAVLRDGERPYVLSLFGRQIRFDLNAGFPLVTTRKLAFKLAVAELRWYLRGDTNIKFLNENGVRFWNEWADEQGELGPVYGKQWRNWEGPNGEKVDQIANLVQGVKAALSDRHAPEARRLLLTAWNPVDIPRIPKAPPACHTLAHFNITDGRLSCLLYQRSADMFLGVPYNIACYSLLTHLLAKVAGLGVGEFVHTFGDAHIYGNHLDQVDEQLKREPYPLPRLVVEDGFASLDDFRPEHVRLENYQSHSALKGEVAV